MMVGVLFLLFGISILVKIFFKIDIPVFRTFFAVFLIYLGFRMLFGTYGSHGWVGWKTEDSAVFSNQSWRLGPQSEAKSEFNVVFGRGTVDLTHASLDKGDLRVEVNTVFGETRVIIDPAIPTRIHATAVFGQARLPDRGTVAFGSLTYRSKEPPKDTKEAPRMLRVSGNAVFGTIRFVTQEEAASGASAHGDDDED